jgi:hypothetical protein
MDIEKFMDNLADEMEKLEMEMRSEEFYRDIISRSDDIGMSNLACGILACDGANVEQSRQGRVGL